MIVAEVEQWDSDKEQEDDEALKEIGFLAGQQSWERVITVKIFSEINQI